MFFFFVLNLNLFAAKNPPKSKFSNNIIHKLIRPLPFLIDRKTVRYSHRHLQLGISDNKIRWNNRSKAEENVPQDSAGGPAHCQLFFKFTFFSNSFIHPVHTYIYIFYVSKEKEAATIAKKSSKKLQRGVEWGFGLGLGGG